jgi:TetR/AcrR family transcriptional repressor of nem operon
LRAAFEEMHRSGFRNADLDAILARAGVTKGALYYHFDNKEALGYAVVDEVMTSDLHQKWVQPLRNAKNPIDVLVRIVQSESLKREDIRRSCPLLNLSKRCQVLMRDSAEGRQNFLGLARCNRGSTARRTETWDGKE